MAARNGKPSMNGAAKGLAFSRKSFLFGLSLLAAVAFFDARPAAAQINLNLNLPSWGGYYRGGGGYYRHHHRYHGRHYSYHHGHRHHGGGHRHHGGGHGHHGGGGGAPVPQL